MESKKRNLPFQYHQRFLLIVYPFTLITAFLYSSLGNPPNSYFSQKHNIFNQYFVKIGWFWVTLVYFSYLYFVTTKRLQKTNALVASLGRYAVVTCYWYVLTQSLFGPSVIDRLFVLSGGSCISLLNKEPVSVLEQKVCRKLGGSWTGGHDVSGHCVLLIHASLFLWEEISWIFYKPKTLTELKVHDRAQYWSVISVLSLLALWLFMLFITGVYFHGDFEVLSGTLFGMLGWAILYLGVFPRVLALKI